MADQTINTAGWLRRQFGWPGSGEQWLTLALLLAAACTFVWLLRYSEHLSAGQMVLAFSLWLLVFCLVCQHLVKDFFGPVFLYELIRLGRNRSTFIIRGICTVGLGLLLGLMYYEGLGPWQDGGHEEASKEAQLALSVIFVLIAGCIYFFGRELLSKTLRYCIMAVALPLGVYFFFMALIGFLSDDHANTAELVPHTVVTQFTSKFFLTYIVLQFLALTVLTPAYVAGAVANEKDRRTLDFILATDLKNREIIFGKLAARVMTLIQFVLLGLPIIAFLQLLGGIDPELLLAFTAASIALILGLSAVSIWCSTRARTAGEAIRSTLWYILIYALGTWFALIGLNLLAVWSGHTLSASVLGYCISLDQLVDWFASGNPLVAASKLAMGGMTSAPNLAAILRNFLGFWAIVTVLFSGIAVLRLRRIAQQHAESGMQQPRAAKLFGKLPAVRIGQSAARKLDSIPFFTAKRPPIDGNPILWKETFTHNRMIRGFWGMLTTVLLLLVLMLPLCMLIFSYAFQSDGTLQFARILDFWDRITEDVNLWVKVVTGILGTLLLLEAAIRGAGTITKEQERDTWNCLLTTPLTTREILLGKWCGSVLGPRRLYLLFLAVLGLGLALGSVSPVIIPILLLLTAIYVSAFAWIGIWCSLTARRTQTATLRALAAAVLGLGGFLGFLNCCCFSALNIFSTSSRSYELWMSFFCGFTPPLVMGIAPLRDVWEINSLNGQLGPFQLNSNTSAGLLGPCIGTLFWLGCSFLLYVLCARQLDQQTHGAAGRKVD